MVLNQSYKRIFPATCTTFQIHPNINCQKRETKCSCKQREFNQVEKSKIMDSLIIKIDKLFNGVSKILIS